MNTKAWLLLWGFFLCAGIMLSAGCFTMPTSPALLTSGGSADSSGGHHHPGDDPEGVFVPTPTPAPTYGGGTGNGSISGTVSNSAGGQIIVFAVLGSTSVFAEVHIVGDGPFTLSGLSDGDYEVTALEGTSMTNEERVTISGENAVTDVRLSF
ncbi:hypothetical protein KAR34_10530 [bacterium]|nr:hypothetical protein [bacterium]